MNKYTFINGDAYADFVIDNDLKDVNLVDGLLKIKNLGFIIIETNIKITPTPAPDSVCPNENSFE